LILAAQTVIAIEEKQSFTPHNQVASGKNARVLPVIAIEEKQSFTLDNQIASGKGHLRHDKIPNNKFVFGDPGYLQVFPSRPPPFQDHEWER